MEFYLPRETKETYKFHVKTYMKVNEMKNMLYRKIFISPYICSILS